MKVDTFGETTLMGTPQVSIIMAAYNHARYIDKAIASALAQTWQDFELIVVDDGSTDTTSQVVSQFGEPVRYIYQQNRGQGGARNRGIAEALGTFICFLDDDDLWEPHYLATVMSVFQKQPKTDALYTGFQIIDADGTVLPQKGCRVVPPDQMYNALVGGGWFPPLVVTVRKTCLDQVGPLDETLRGHDDWDLWLRIARDHIFRGIPDTVARYRIHAGGLSANFDHMLQDQKLAIVRHFGPEEGPPAAWPEERRRAFGAAYRNAGLACVQSKNADRGYQLLKLAFGISPNLLLDLSTFYELALGDQQRGFRGQVDLVDIERNGAEMLQRLNDLIASADRPVQEIRNSAFGKAYLALAILSDQANDWTAARRYLWRAILTNPRLTRDPSVMRRLFKLFAGQHIANSMRHLRSKTAGSIAQLE